jgi:hypothetical protein
MLSVTLFIVNDWREPLSVRASPSSEGKGARHAWHHIDHDPGFSTDRCAAALVAQPKLGLRPPFVELGCIGLRGRIHQLAETNYR